MGIAKLPVTIATARPVITRILDQIELTEKKWTTQSRILTYLLMFLGNVHFFMDDDLAWKIVDNIAIPSLLNSISDVAELASYLLSFMLRNFATVGEKVMELCDRFAVMLNNEKGGVRVAGSRGLISIVRSTVTFDHVEKFVVKALAALADAADRADSAVADVVNQFFTEFW
jgi:hypothetical protein